MLSTIALTDNTLGHFLSPAARDQYYLHVLDHNQSTTAIYESFMSDFSLGISSWLISWVPAVILALISWNLGIDKKMFRGTIRNFLI